VANSTGALRPDRYSTLILDSASEGIWSVGLDGLITYVNKAALQVFRFTDESQMIGKHSHELVHYKRADGSFYPREECPIYRAFLKGVPAHLDDEVLWRGDGTSFYADYRSWPIYENEKIIGAVVTFTDNSEKRRIQEERQMAESKLKAAREALAAVIAHDLKTPIQAISLMVYLCLDSDRRIETDKALVDVNDLHLIRRNVDQLNRLAGDILDVARIETNQLALFRTKLDLLEAINRLVEEIRLTLGEHEISIQSDGTDFQAPVDLARFRQIITNLLVNAAKYSPPNTPIRVFVTQAMQEVDISIQDQGIGIPAEFLPKIFDRFYRVKAVKDSKDGLGLGLFITQALVKGHGGEIRVESELGKGSTFHLSFPSQLDSTVSPDAADAPSSTIVASGPETPK
jgi:PAS domain S-box-containing protein